MQADFEIKYLDITWYDKETVLKVIESFTSLTLDYDQQNKTFICDAILYPEAPGIKHGQLAFRFLTENKVEPYFELTDGSKFTLKKVIDKETNKVWWIEANQWVTKNNTWQRKSHRTAGQIKSWLNTQNCLINIGSSEFTAPQLKRYLADFKNDLWELILDESSYITGEGKKNQGGGVNEESIALINSILSHTQKILKNPKAELREVQMLKPRKMVKPVTRTFMELATKGDGRFLTSRATKPSYNVAENRYILFALEKTYKILNQLVRISNSKINRFENTLEKLNERYNSFSDEKFINKDLVLKDLEKLRLSCCLVELNKSLTLKLNNSEIRAKSFSGLHTWYIKLEKALDKNEGYFLGVKIQFTDPWFDFTNNNQTIILKFCDDSLKDFFSPFFEYRIVATLELYSATAKTGKPYNIYTIQDLYEIEILNSEQLNKTKDKYLAMNKKVELLKANQWIKKLTVQELSEQLREKKSVQNQIKFFQNTHKKAKHVNELLSPKLLKYKEFITKLKNKGIKPLSTFPNSMTFVQNPDYQAIHSGYKKIREFTNLTDDDLLLSLEKVEEIGLINMPLLYERWCLLQIIKVLVQNYHYIPSGNWKRKLLKIVKTGKHNEPIKLLNENLKRGIKLWYEPTLKNGRKPDFVVDIIFLKKDIKNMQQYKKRLVLDAKFYSDDLLKRIGGISKTITELYHTKDYSEGGKNSVFMLHPAKNSIPDVISPQIWGENSFLGELKMFDWDDKLRQENFHSYGAVCANPILRIRYLDEIQRLLGMFLQYGIEDNDSRRSSDDVESINFCISCGSGNLKQVNTYTGNIKSSWYECNICQHFTTYNHCKCGTRLIKNGDYWTYHSQMPMEPLNIKCPKCESLV